MVFQVLFSPLLCSVIDSHFFFFYSLNIYKMTSCWNDIWHLEDIYTLINFMFNFAKYVVICVLPYDMRPLVCFITEIFRIFRVSIYVIVPTTIVNVSFITWFFVILCLKAIAESNLILLMSSNVVQIFTYCDRLSRAR